MQRNTLRFWLQSRIRGGGGPSTPGRQRLPTSRKGPGFVFLSGLLASLHLWIVLVIGLPSLGAEEIPVVTARPVARKLIIIPFSNLSDSSNLDYLETGLPEMILNGMTLPVFLRDFRPPDVVLDPSGRAARSNRYSTPALQESVIGSDREKIRLEGTVHRWKPNQAELVERASGFEVAATLDADYLLTGRIKGSRSAPVLELEFYDAVWGRKSVSVLALPSRNPYEENTLRTIRRFVESRLPGLGSGRIQVSSAKAGALVFLDDVYIGKTPLNENVAPGKYELRVSHEQCQDHSQSIDLQGEQSFSVDCKPAGGEATLVVESNPPGASVFLNLTFLGKTPLKVENLKEGTHRIRISLEDHIDRFQGVELKSRKTSRLSVDMTVGDTEEFYRDPGYVIADWTHHDLAFGLMLQSLVLGGGWAYSSIRANDVRDSIRAQIPALAITDVPSFSLYQFSQIESNRLDAKAWDNRANLFSGAAIASLVLSGVFLWLGYEHDDKEFGELGLLEQQLRYQAWKKGNGKSGGPDDSTKRHFSTRAGPGFPFDRAPIGVNSADPAAGLPYSIQWFWNVQSTPLQFMDEPSLPAPERLRAPAAAQNAYEIQHRLGLRFAL
ncbi:MAG: PEGA domain-containing protein [Leptospiraceae bacterium]|nr:PEGA domain-containing protein [Leptospiraceae bacterium]